MSSIFDIRRNSVDSVSPSNGVTRGLLNAIFDWKVRRLRMRERVKTSNDNGLRIWIFSQKLPFSVEKNVSKTNLGSTIQYTYTSYNKYFRLGMVSEELRLNEIGLFL